MLALPDQWVWDFWLARDDAAPGRPWHIYFLKADKALGNEALRHWNVSYGHASSADLSRWTHHGTCFAPAPSPSWDDKTTWTGCVVRDPEAPLWHLFYTGTCRAEDGRRQRLGHATSTDLHAWKRVGDGLILDLNEDWYEEYYDGPWDGRAMRDPWVMRDPDGRGWLMYFTARANQPGELNARGAVGLARSDDLYRWRLHPPVYAGGDFGQLEVPQVFELGGRWYCVFCNAGEHWSEAYRQRYRAECGGSPVTGSHYLMAPHPLGPWTVAPGPFLDGCEPCRRYAAKVVFTNGGPVLMGFDYWGGDGTFLGTIGEPVPIEADAATGLLRFAVR